MPALTSVHLTPYCGQMKPSWFAASLGPNSVFGFPGVKETLSQPKVMPPNITVVESWTLKSTCETPTGTKTLLWDHDDSVLVPGGCVGLSPGNRALTVLGVSQDDAGNYTCEVRNPVSHNRSRPVTVTVVYGLDAATVAPPGLLDQAVGSGLGLT
ncbi:carcinoembryonic antigen-related cell adhesion molecule 6 [Alligator mississippiensis]|nr:carcinoembryonic antigen-related cell adhesion molecule 6 [Alligator mississippiensis]